MGNALDGKVAVVTGGGRGIGRGVSLLLASEGARVVVNDYGVAVDGSQPSDGPAAEVAEEIRAAGGQAAPNFDSVATMEGGEKMIKQALDEFGRLDIVVNVAGILRDRMVFNMTEEEWDSVVAVHLKGHFTTTKPASIIMRQQRSGRIITFTSGSGLRGSSGQANYGAAKAGIAGFTRVIARDLGRYGVTCNSISPGAQTRMTATVPQSAREARSARGIATAPPPPSRRSAGRSRWRRWSPTSARTMPGTSTGRSSPSPAAPSRCSIIRRPIARSSKRAPGHSTSCSGSSPRS